MLQPCKRQMSFFEAYSWLNIWAQEHQSKAFHIVIKHHTFLNLVQNSVFLNQKFHWCFKAEDFVGKISRVAHSVSMGVRSTKLSTKLAPNYQLLLHFRFTRQNFVDILELPVGQKIVLRTKLPRIGGMSNTIYCPIGQGIVLKRSSRTIDCTIFSS